MIVLFTGSRQKNPILVPLYLKAVEAAVTLSGWKIDAIMEGGCANSPDIAARVYGLEKKIKVFTEPADWDNLTAPGAVIRTNRAGKPYNVNAGFDRNKDMVRKLLSLSDTYGGVGCIAIHDGVSRGTRQQVDYALSQGIPVFYCKVDLANRTMKALHVSIGGNCPNLV